MLSGYSGDSCIWVAAKVKAGRQESIVNRLESNIMWRSHCRNIVETFIPYYTERRGLEVKKCALDYIFFRIRAGASDWKFLELQDFDIFYFLCRYEPVKGSKVIRRKVVHPIPADEVEKMRHWLQITDITCLRDKDWVVVTKGAFRGMSGYIDSPKGVSGYSDKELVLCLAVTGLDAKCTVGADSVVKL